MLRSRFTEDHLAASRERLRQYVVLGAGLDSFALRMGDALGGLTVYEVDDPPFQEWKSQRIRELGLQPPAQLRFVPCDFEAPRSQTRSRQPVSERRNRASSRGSG